MSIALVLVLVAGAFTAVLATAAQAQEPTGATATKDCPNAPLNDPYTIGDTVTCTATFTNDGFFPATVTLLTETAPFVVAGSPANGAPIDIECTLPDGTTVINEGDTLAPDEVCTATFGVTIPDDPALCNTAFRDRGDIGLEYPQFTPPLTAGAFATHTLLVVCGPPDSSTTTTTTTVPGGPTPPPSSRPPLARTGAALNMAAVAGIAAVFAGCIALLAGGKLRRRRARLGIGE